MQLGRKRDRGLGYTHLYLKNLMDSVTAYISTDKRCELFALVSVRVI